MFHKYKKLKINIQKNKKIKLTTGYELRKQLNYFDRP